MPAQLVALSDGPNILLDKPILLLGRHAECDIQLNSRKVSRRHCCIAQVNTYLVVRDLGSTNGIRINGVRVLEGRLKAGDELTVGNFRYNVTLDDQPAPPPPRPAPKPAPAKPRQNPIPVATPATSHAGATESDEDGILKWCDAQVMLGRVKKKKDVPRPIEPPDEEGTPPPGEDSGHTFDGTDKGVPPP